MSTRALSQCLPLIRLGLFAALLLTTLQPTRAAEYVWLEGEAPTSVNVKPQVAGWGHTEFLSGEKWLQVSIDADKVDKELPAGGAVLSYAFNITGQGNYEVWDRIGYEFIRSPFEWRVDDGAWAVISPQQLTTDLMELQTWNEVAWIKLGSQSLAPGAHKLEIRLNKTTDAKGQTEHVLYASDSLCISAQPFHPNSKYKPDESGRDATDEEAAKKMFDIGKGQQAMGYDVGGPSTSLHSTKIGYMSEFDGPVSVPLNGLWEVCRNDEDIPVDIARPMTDFPAEPHWKAIQVPGDKNTLRPDLLFAHRIWYRTRVNVEALAGGRSYQLVFPQNNLNTTVYVNGVFCGFNKNPFARFSIDVTKGIKLGVNEIWVGIRDAWYGYSESPTDKMKLRRVFNLPLSFLGTGFQDLAYPIWSHPESGILVTPEFVVSGSVYASDIFVKPSVAKKELAAEITLSNTTTQEATGEITCEAIDSAGVVAKKLPAKPFTLAAGAEQTIEVAGGWDDPKLWWPDTPNLYTLHTHVVMNGETVDTSVTSFGFREWSSDGPNFKLNGIVWHGWAELGEEPTPESWLKWYRDTNQTTFRFWGTTWMGMSPDDALDYFDKNGVTVRRSGILDGEAIGYSALEQDPELQKQSRINLALMRNWRDQVVAQVKGERNHPSVQLWSIENEYLYINCINLFGGLMDDFEREVKKTSDAVLAVDPTRLNMTDGGGANKDNSMPVHGNHYVYTGGGEYPALAYDKNPAGGGRGRWVWDQKRPRFIGEDYFATGINPADYAWLGGEAPFQGKSQARPAAGIITRMLTEGYRWAGISAFNFWEGGSSATDYYQSNAPVAVFCRQWDWTFSAGQKVKRTLSIFNDSHTDSPITFSWALTVGGKTVKGAPAVYNVQAGTNTVFEMTLPIPQVAARSEGKWTLMLARDGKTVFVDSKTVSVLPRPTVDVNLRALTDGEWEEFGRKSHISKITAQNHPTSFLVANTPYIYDPYGSIAAFLKRIKASFKQVANLNDLPASAQVLIIGKDALDPATSTSSKLAAYASAGRTVIVLEQKNPLKYQAIPAAMETTGDTGRIAFADDLNHPVLRGLAQKDFFTWGPDEIVYRNAYQKPTSGGKSLVQCDSRLNDTALVEVPAGTGLLLLSQLEIGEKLATNAVAQQLLANMISYGSSYKLEYRPVTVTAGDAPLLTKAVDAAGLRYAKAADPMQAISAPGQKLAVVSASPENLAKLAANMVAVRKFTEAGGWIVFNGLTPEGLASYNKIVGFNHMIRPFKRERVTFPPTKNPLTSGLTTGDVVQMSSERMFPWTADMFASSDEFSYVVDYDEVAPFAKFPSADYDNMVNGFVSADGWKYIFSFSIDAATNKPPDFTMSWPTPQEFTEFTWIGNGFYHFVKKLDLTFDGNKSTALSIPTVPNIEPQVFAFTPPRKAKDLNIRLSEWTDNKSGNVVGVDNLYLKVKRSPEFYKNVRPMLNIGALMEYPRGAGGIVLCNVLFKDTEDVPENAGKKRTILATILRNLKAPFSGGKAIIAGANLTYTPVDISKQANQYRNAQGWFGDKNFTFQELPFGKQTFAGVPYNVYEFPTSPVPTAIMLGGSGIPNNLPSEVRGIPVNLKADALFFLQAARIDQRRNRDEIRDHKQFEIARYVVTYTDGQTVNVPIYAEIGVDDYRQTTPTAIPGAQIAWTKPYAGTDQSAVAYAMQWNNPRPDVQIKSIDLVAGAQKQAGVPALLALTAARGK